MPAKLRLGWVGEEHRLAVTEGRSTIAQMAEEHGVTRMALHKLFRRRGWGTSIETGAAPTASASGDAEASAPISTATPATPGPSSSWIACVVDEESAAQLGRHAAINALLLVIARATDALSRQLGPQQVRQSAAALETAIGELRRLGIGIDGDRAAGQNAVILIDGMSLEEETAVRQAAEDEFGNDFGREPRHADEADEEIDAEAPESLVQRLATLDAVIVHPEASRAPEPSLGPFGKHGGHAGLGARLELALAGRGHHRPRQVAVVCGLEPTSDPHATVAALVEAAADDPDLAARLDVELARAGF